MNIINEIIKICIANSITSLFVIKRTNQYKIVEAPTRDFRYQLISKIKKIVLTTNINIQKRLNVCMFDFLYHRNYIIPNKSTFTHFLCYTTRCNPVIHFTFHTAPRTG